MSLKLQSRDLASIIIFVGCFCIYVPPCAYITVYILCHIYTLYKHSILYIFHIVYVSTICIILLCICPAMYISSSCLCLYSVYTLPCIGFTICMSLLFTTPNICLAIGIYVIPKF